MKKLTRHHRRPKSLGGRGVENISRIPVKKHRAWHILFSNWPPEKIVAEINRVYIDPDVHVVLERRC